MKYKLIALDLDGTLLNSDKKISQKNLDAINAAKEKGVKIIIITGRERNSLSTAPYIDQLDNKELTGYYQGSLVVDEFNGEQLYACTLQKNDCNDVYNDAVKRNLNMIVYRGGNAYSEMYDEYSVRYEKHNKTKITALDSIEELVNSDENLKMLITVSQGQIDKNFEYFFSKYSKRMNVVTSSKHYIEFTHKDASKGNALKFIASRYKVDKSEIIAMGDQLNDLSMINFAGMGVAMGNAAEEVKQKADFVTLSNDEDGVAFAIENILRM